MEKKINEIEVTEIIVGDVVERFTDVRVLPVIREIFETFGIEYDVNVFKVEIPPYLNVTKKLHSGDDEEWYEEN